MSISIPTYEYKRVPVEQRQGGIVRNVDDALQELGEQGWALVAIHGEWFYFRRQKGLVGIDG